jgi:putative aldouronate transport system permease protein
MNIRTNGEKAFSVFNYFIMAAIGILTIYPLWHVFMSSISDPNILFVDRGFYFWPKGMPSFRGYTLVFENPNVISGYFNTLFYLVVGTVMCMFVTILGAYVLSRKGLYWNGIVMKLIIFTMYFQGWLIPFYIQVRNMNMIDSRWSIVLPILVNTWNLIILRTGFAAVPDSLIESAKIDGASDWRIIWTIAVPMAKATISVIGLYYAVRFWNEWFNPSIFLTDRTKWPIQLILREILLKNDTGSMTQIGTVGQSQQERYRMLVKYCTIIVSTVPILVAYPFIQKYFVAGMMIGSVKE